jgi:hypothetical protein
MQTRRREVRAQESIGTPQLEFTLHEIRCDADGDLLYEVRAPS